MKIQKSIRELYQDQFEYNDKLKSLVDKKLNALKDDRWHYESRIKSIESFSLKIETGRVIDFAALEDFFACTLVVENNDSINKAEKLITNRFKLYERRPHNNYFTFKESHSFRFDDLRLYVKWIDDEILPPTGVDGVLFEVQIKTFLQHAWSIATHDLIYKTDIVNWGMERIAYQIKAMLEHAEISIQEAAKLSSSKALKKTNKYTKKMVKVIGFLKEKWEVSALPKDIVRLADSVKSLIEAIDIDLDRLRSIVDEETECGKGIKTLNLSPYGIIIQSLLNKENQRFIKFLSESTGGLRILIPQEIILPGGINRALLKKAIFI